MPSTSAKSLDLGLSALLIGLMAAAQALPDSATWSASLFSPVVFKVFLISAIGAFIQHTRTPGEFGQAATQEKPNA
jgi:hypothetical protein